MFDQLGSLLSSPWVYALVGSSILLDVFLPVLPSGALLVAAATAGTAGQAFETAEIALLLLCAATASCLGDFAAYRLAWRGGDWLARRMERSSKLSAAQRRLGDVVENGGGGLVVLARFAPAGRSVVSVAAGAAHRTVSEFLPWSALAGVAWAGYSVGIGYLGGQWLGASWITVAASFTALVCVSTLAARAFRRSPRPAPGPAAPAAAVSMTAVQPVPVTASAD